MSKAALFENINFVIASSAFMVNGYLWWTMKKHDKEYKTWTGSVKDMLKPMKKTEKIREVQELLVKENERVLDAIIEVAEMQEKQTKDKRNLF